MQTKSRQSNFADTQNYYASVIERLGEAVLSDGRTLAANLTFMEIPFWSVFAPELAWRHLTTAEAAKTPISKIGLRVKPYIRNSLNAIKNLIKNSKKTSIQRRGPDCDAVLCLNMTPRMYEDVLAPVVTYICQSSSNQVVVLGIDQVNSSAQFLNPITSCIWDYWDDESERIANRIRADLRRFVRSGQITACIESLRDGSPEVKASLQLMVHLLLETYLPQIIDHAAVTKTILTKYRPSLVLSADTSDARCRLFTLLAAELDIPSLEVQFGLAGDESVEWSFFSADHVAVWGTDAKNALLRQGVPEAKILLTGSPRHDAMVNPAVERLAVLRAALFSGDTRPIVLLASTYVDSTHADFAHPSVLREMKMAIVNSAKRHPGLVLAVKPHPHEKVEEMRELINGAPNIRLFDKDIDIRNLISVCDVFISFGSTATIDALVAGRPSVCPVFPGWPFSLLFQNTGAVLVPQSSKEIDAIFVEVEQSGHLELPMNLLASRKDFLQKTAYLADGNASKRIGDVAVQMLARK